MTVSAQGRVFVNFPFWSDDHTISVAEIVDGKPKPFPDDAWNARDSPPGGRWVCVQSVVVDNQDGLWVLDPASPKTEAVVPGGPKLVKIDLAANKERAFGARDLIWHTGAALCRKGRVGIPGK